MKGMQRAAGVLFLISTCTYLVGSGILAPILHRTDLLARMDSDRTSVFAGMFLDLVNALAVVGIAVFLHPVLKRHHEGFALGYLGSRIMESVLLLVSLIGPLGLLTLSKTSISAGTSGESSLQTIGSTVVEAHFMLFDLAMIVLGVGGLLFCQILYRAVMVPRWLSIIGFIGYVGLMVSASLSIVGQEVGSILYIPGAVFELVLPVWLIVKGLRLPAEEA
jgi:hypothetical protein